MEDGEESLDTVDPEPDGIEEFRSGGPMVSEADSDVEEGSEVPDSCAQEPESDQEDETKENILPVSSVKSTNSDASEETFAVDHDSVPYSEERLLGSDSGGDMNGECETLEKSEAEDRPSLDNSHLASPVLNDEGSNLEQDSVFNDIQNGAEANELRDNEVQENVGNIVEPRSALWQEASPEGRTVFHQLSEEDNMDNSESVSDLKVPEKQTDSDLSVDDVSEKRTEGENILRVSDVIYDRNTSTKSEWGMDAVVEEEPCHNGDSISRDSSRLSNDTEESNLNVSPTSPLNRISNSGEDSLNECSNMLICDSADQTDRQEGLTERGARVLRLDSCKNLSLSSVIGVGDSCAEDVGEDVNGSVDKIESFGEVCDREAGEEDTVNSEMWDAADAKGETSPLMIDESRCNGDIDSPVHPGETEWDDSVETSSQAQQAVDECGKDNLSDGKRKHSVDSTEVRENSSTDNSSSQGPMKMFKIDHNVTHVSNHTVTDKSCATKAPLTSSQSVDSSLLFPDNIQGTSHLTQYLGLQPTLKFKCVRCGEKSFSSMMDLKTHQYACLKNHTVAQPSPAPAQCSPYQTSSTNFRITRKVYLCSVCGTYYENWNLFLHMREVHKRHICLFCLGMFSQAERLAAHLVSKHKIVEGQFASAEEFRLSCKGSVFLMCCSCEKVFSEEDSYCNHPCKEKSATTLMSSTNHSLVSMQNQVNSLPHPGTAAFTDRSKTKFGETGGLVRPVNSRPVDNKLGKSSVTKGKSQMLQSGFSGFDSSGFTSASYGDSGPSSKANSGRPKQILKVKIPIQPKKQNGNSLHSSPAPPSVTMPAPVVPSSSIAPRNDPEPMQTAVNSTYSEFYSRDVPNSDGQPCGVLSRPTDDNVMTNLDRTINAVALGLSSEGLEWQQRKDEEMREIDEPTSLLSLDGATKSDSDSDGESAHSYQSEENLPDEDSPDKPDLRLPEEPERLPSPILAPMAEPMEVEHTSVDPSQHPEVPSIVSPDVEPPDVEPPDVEPLIEAQQPLEASSEMSPSKPAEETLPSTDTSAPPQSPSSSTQDPPPEPTPAEDESDLDTDDSDKLSLIVDETPSGAENEEKIAPDVTNETKIQEQPPEDTVPADVAPETVPDEAPTANEILAEKIGDLQLAGDDVPVTEVAIEQPLEEVAVQALLKECVKNICYSCVYCSHARRIAVNGKQLALHALAEHRFLPVDGTDEQELPPSFRFIFKLKDSLQALQDMYFNTDTYDSTDKSSCIPYDRTYECFHCHFFTRSHKELYIHNRKMHQKTILLCIMCKLNFYSYSELLCHLCPGIYIPQCNVGFHCCMCEVDNLPSAFRLMVHLRKRHHTCDVCLEITDDQQKLSSHVWKHKLHHLCYRCGIAYRNKPDITNHLFWKHGTESVLCKKCLQKKWPHVYHFCVPPATFTCEECNSLFTRAVSLRVHKRLHSGEQPHQCTECEEKFISKRLLAKHIDSHRAPPPEENVPSREDLIVDDKNEGSASSDRQNSAEQNVSEENKNGKTRGHASDTEKDTSEDAERDRKHSSKKKKHKEKEKEEQKQKKLVDVYDLPPLNLSSESDSSDEDEKKDKSSSVAGNIPPPTQPVAPMDTAVPQADDAPAPVVDGIWDKFQSYKASLERLETAETLAKIAAPVPTQEDISKSLYEVIKMEHDYCLLTEEPPKNNTDVPSETTTNQDQEIQETPSTDPASKVEPEVETPNVELNPPSTPPHSKDDSKSAVSSESPSKKKRSPKKKIKRRSSSSSSNSSSGSDSSSCSCGTNCSCSSSSSSDSSSSSSDSDSSSSEGRRRRESRKEKKKEEGDKENASSGTPPPAEGASHPPVEEPHIDVMEPEPTFRESDLDTTETETDEDFYDERPQKPPDESQVEKRNLMLLASVAPLNNGGISPLTQQNDQPEVTSEEQTLLQQQLLAPSLNPAAVTGKKRTKKRKKKQTSRFHPKLVHKPAQPPEVVATGAQQVSLVSQSAISPERFTSMYYPQNAPSPVSPAAPGYNIMTPPFQQSTPVANPKRPIVSKLSRELITNAGSGSETEGRTKRKRMPNKFYGYSSDEEAEDTQHTTTVHKWRKTDSSSIQPTLSTSMSTTPRPHIPTITIKHTPLPPVPEPVQLPVPPTKIVVSRTESDSESESKRVTSSSSSSDSDDDAMQISEIPPTGHVTTALGGDMPVRETHDNLYCYCQCPYDEVSEMIACDGKNCAIEWFHFECVGIMVPPKGQWYCPDCRKHMTNYLGSE